MATAKLSPKFQISLPKEIREQMHLESGQVFLVIPRGDIIQLVPKRTLDDFKGKLAGANKENTRDREDRI